MGFGSTAKKLQRVTELADKLYERFEKLREQVNELTGTVEETNDRVATLESELSEQRALLEALAEEQGVDAEEVTADVSVSEGGDSAAETAAGRTADDGGGWQRLKNAGKNYADNDHPPGGRWTRCSKPSGRRRSCGCRPPRTRCRCTRNWSRSTPGRA